MPMGVYTLARIVLGTRVVPYIHSVGFCIAYSNISVFSGPQTTDKQ